jgi:hypothetical protein
MAGRGKGGEMEKLIKCSGCAFVLGSWDYSFPSLSDCNLLNMTVTVKCPKCDGLITIGASSSGCSSKNVGVRTATTATTSKEVM